MEFAEDHYFDPDYIDQINVRLDRHAAKLSVLPFLDCIVKELQPNVINSKITARDPEVLMFEQKAKREVLMRMCKVFELMCQLPTFVRTLVEFSGAAAVVVHCLYNAHYDEEIETCCHMLRLMTEKNADVFLNTNALKLLCGVVKNCDGSKTLDDAFGAIINIINDLNPDVSEQFKELGGNIILLNLAKNEFKLLRRNLKFMENTPGLAKHLDMSVAHFYVKLYLRSMRPEEKADLMKSIESVCRAYQEGIDDELIYFLLFQLKSTTCHHIYSSAARALTYATFMSESISMAYEFVVDLLLQILTGSDTSYHRKEWSPEDICREILSADSAATDADDVDTKEILSCIRNVLTSMEVRKYFINDDISMNLLEFLLINYRFHQTAKDIIFLLLKNEHLYKIFILQFIPLRIFLAERMLQNYVKILSFSIANVYTSNERVLTKLLAKKGEARKRAVLSLYLFARFKLFSDLIMAKSTISDLTEMIYEDSTYRKLALLAVSEIPRKASELATNNRFHNTSCYETNAVCCDLILRFDNENTIWVSRDILSYHSDVFRAMFFGGFSETGKAEVHLPCDSFEEFQLLYKLLLQNHVDSSHGDMDDSSMVGVLELADKYLMKEVYGIVLNHIKSNTRPFLESLIESDILRYKEELLSHTFKYVCVKIPETSKRLEMLEKIIDNFVPQDLFEDFLYDMLDESQKQGLHLADFP